MKKSKLLFILLSLFLLILMINQGISIEKGSFEEEAVYYTWEVKGDSKLPNVFLIGDSISIGYHFYVVEALKGIANIYRPVKNISIVPVLFNLRLLYF